MINMLIDFFHCDSSIQKTINIERTKDAVRAHKLLDVELASIASREYDARKVH